jgi:tetratricopeptide (TPR) repeat protein
VRTLLREGRFGEVQELMSRFIGDKRLSRNGYLYASSVVDHTLVATDTWENKADLLPHLELWVQQSPGSSLALTFRGAFHDGAAWKARGQGWASTVSQRGRTLMREHLALAVRDLEAASKLDAGNPLPPIRMVSAARTLGADPQTLDLHFRRVLAYDAGLLEPYRSKLEYLKPKWGGSEEAMFAFARESSWSAPKGSAIPQLLGEAHSEKGRNLSSDDEQYLTRPEVWSEIHGVYELLLREFPQSGLWASEFAGLARRAGRLEEARKYYDLAVKRDPEEFEVRYERGRFFEEVLADFPRALDEYTEATRLEPLSSKAHYKQGSVQARTSQWRKAITTYSTLVKLEPEDPRVYFQRASSYFMEKQYHEAVQDYSQAIALKPDYRNAYQWRAACYERLGMPDKQQEDLRILKSLP